MDAGQSIVLVIGIVDKHRIRFFIFQAECAVICDRNILWILISLVVFYCQIPILVFIKIGVKCYTNVVTVVANKI